MHSRLKKYVLTIAQIYFAQIDAFIIDKMQLSNQTILYANEKNHYYSK